MHESLVKLVISATFTAEPLESVLAFWMNIWGFAGERTYAPYNQVFQQLLDDNSMFAVNVRGANISLVRLEDFDSGEVATNTSSANLTNGAAPDAETRVASDLVTAITSAAIRDVVPHIVCLCPGSPTNDVSLQERRSRFEKTICQSLGSVAGVYTITTADIMQMYPVSTCHDAVGDAIGQIPYTPLFFAALGTTIARTYVSITRAPYKVLVLDCDQTLWSGISAEDGPLGVVIDGPRKALQQNVINQQKQGVLLCLCSKNIEEDVWSVFDQNQDMVMTRDHITSWRINWKAKSENLRSLAHELKLGLDSFIFVDDSAIECAEVRGNCSEVLVIQLPASSEEIPEYLRHIWAFDRTSTTSEDLTRTRFYRENATRERLRAATLSLEVFLSRLNLVVQISEAAENDIPRMAQLCERTNQFNLSGRRWSEEELSQAQRGVDINALVVRVKDRFGDYGLVGLMLFRQSVDSILVDTFLLSCRALGRGVEYRMIQELGQICTNLGLEHIELPYKESSRNEPIRSFLDDIQTGSNQPLQSEFQVRLNASSALELVAEDSRLAAREALPAPVSDSDTGKTSRAATDHEQNRTDNDRIALQLNTPGEILSAIEDGSRMSRDEMTSTFERPSTPTEQVLTDIWSIVLLIDRIGRTDNFLELGGDSLKAVMVLSRIYTDLKVKLSLLDFFKSPTVSQLAEVIDRTAPDTNADIAP